MTKVTKLSVNDNLIKYNGNTYIRPNNGAISVVNGILYCGSAKLVDGEWKNKEESSNGVKTILRFLKFW